MERRFNSMKRGLLSLGVMLAIGGCVSPSMERSDVRVHAVSTSVGTGWVYRTDAKTESIITGQQSISSQSTITHDVELLKKAWSNETPRISVLEDAAGPYIFMALGDATTKRLNPLKGGPFAWDLGHLEKGVRAIQSSIGGESPRYSVHLIATEDDRRPQWTEETVAQIRLRRFADVWMQNQTDPRLVTGQVLPPNLRTPWKLGIALRPYQYGKESRNSQLIEPWSLR